ncbi:hypothetical protein ACU8KH_01187 [Lachancea thermotolerans]
MYNTIIVVRYLSRRSGTLALSVFYNETDKLKYQGSGGTYVAGQKRASLGRFMPLLGKKKRVALEPTSP